LKKQSQSPGTVGNRGQDALGTRGRDARDTKQSQPAWPTSEPSVLSVANMKKQSQFPARANWRNYS
jgi:hypothetical protein